MVELVDTRDLKSRGLGRVRAGSSPAPGTTLHDIQQIRTGKSSALSSHMLRAKTFKIDGIMS